MAAVAVEGALGADGPGLEQHPGGVGVAGEAGVVERDGVPAVALVDVGAAAEEEGEAGAVPRAGRLEEVPRGDLLEGHRRLEVLRVELDLDVDAAAAEMLRLVLLPRAVHFFFLFLRRIWRRREGECEWEWEWVRGKYLPVRDLDGFRASWGLGSPRVRGPRSSVRNSKFLNFSRLLPLSTLPNCWIFLNFFYRYVVVKKNKIVNT